MAPQGPEGPVRFSGPSRRENGPTQPAWFVWWAVGALCVTVITVGALVTLMVVAIVKLW